MKRSTCSLACSFLLAGAPLFAAAPGTPTAAAPGTLTPGAPVQTASMDSSKMEALPSPPATAEVTLNGKAVTIHYNAPSMRGRKIMGGLVPYKQVWRTGANPATAFTTATDLKVGGTTVPAGAYTLYTLPSESTWTLILNKQTGQWGTVYDTTKDFAHIPMKKATLPQPQEKMSISFEETRGGSTELHVRWETTDVSVPVTAP